MREVIYRDLVINVASVDVCREPVLSDDGSTVVYERLTINVIVNGDKNAPDS